MSLDFGFIVEEVVVSMQKVFVFRQFTRSFLKQMVVSDVECAAILRVSRRGQTISAIARAFARSRTTVTQIVRRGGAVPRRQRGKLTVGRLQRAMLARKVASRTGVKGKRRVPLFPSARAVADQLRKEFKLVVSRRRVAEDMRAVGGKCRVRPKVPTRALADRKSQRAWCRKALGVNWKRWAFSDETWVTCNEGTTRTMWVFDGVDPLPREFKSKFNQACVQVWFAFGHQWRSEIVIFPIKMNRDGESKNFRLDGADYIRRCLSPTVKLLKKHNSILIQDGARCHVAKNVRAFAKRKGIELTFDWPAYSPVLNEAEQLNAIFKRRVAEHHPTNMEELVAACKRAWKEIPQAMLNRLVKNFQKKLSKYAQSAQNV